MLSRSHLRHRGSAASRLAHAVVVLFAVATMSCASQAQVATSTTGLPTPTPQSTGVTTDSHLHILDFLQNGDFLQDDSLVYSSVANTLPAGHRGKRIEAVLWAMDRANVSHAVIMGMPFLKKWGTSDSHRPRYYLDSDSRMVRARDTDYVLALAIEDFRREHVETADSDLSRLFPFVSGFDGTDLGAVDMVVKRFKEFPDVFVGIGETMSRHDDLSNLTTGERPRGDHPALIRIFDFAGEFGLPVSIRHNIGAISPGGEAKEADYLRELVSAFVEFPDTKFIWNHAGVSRRVIIDGLPAILAGVLEAHREHVWIDLSWVVYEDYILQDLATWVALIERYPDNFVIGSDAVGRYDGYEATLHRYDRLLAELSPDVVAKVGRTNLLSIMPGPLTLPSGYTYPEERYVTVPTPVRSR